MPGRVQESTFKETNMMLNEIIQETKPKFVTVKNMVHLLFDNNSIKESFEAIFAEFLKLEKKLVNQGATSFKINACRELASYFVLYYANYDTNYDFDYIQIEAKTKGKYSLGKISVNIFPQGSNNTSNNWQNLYLNDDLPLGLLEIHSDIGAAVLFIENLPEVYT
jgi:hypothetical protein